MQVSGRLDMICHGDCRGDATESVLNILVLGLCP